MVPTNNYWIIDHQYRKTVQLNRSCIQEADSFITDSVFIVFFSPKGKVQSMQNIVSEHEQYLDAVRDFNDWLISAKEELQRWSDLSGDSVCIKRKLSKVQVRKLNNHNRLIFKAKSIWGYLVFPLWCTSHIPAWKLPQVSTRETTIRIQDIIEYN